MIVWAMEEDKERQSLLRKFLCILKGNFSYQWHTLLLDPPAAAAVDTRTEIAVATRKEAAAAVATRALMTTEEEETAVDP